MWSLLNNFILSFSYALIIIESSILLQTIWFVLFFNSHFKRFRLFEKFWFVFMFYVCFVSFYVVFIFCVDIFPHLYSCLECLFCTNEINAWDSGSCVNTFFFFSLFTLYHRLHFFHDHFTDMCRNAIFL